MSQNLMKFPSTRFLESDYGSILSNSSQNTELWKRLDTCLSEGMKTTGDITSFQPVMPPPFRSSLNRSVNAFSYLDRVEASKHELEDRINSLKRSITCQKKKITSLEPVVRTLIAAARCDPAHSAHMLKSYTRNCSPNLAVVKCSNKLRCAASGNDCKKVTLPFSKFCLQHQSRESSQRLYGSCVVLDPNTLTQCSETVLDIFSELPVCSKHSAMDIGGSTRKKIGLTRPIQKKNLTAKMGVTKIVRGRKMAPHPKVKTNQTENKGATPSTANVWSSGDSNKSTPFNNSNTVQGGNKALTPSKSLDDLLTLSTSLTASLPKLDLLPLKADIGEIMMAGEDSCSGEDETIAN